jgi:hypothetical protein
MKIVFLLLFFLSLNFYLNNLFYKFILNKRNISFNNDDKILDIYKKIYFTKFIDIVFIFIILLIFILSNFLLDYFFKIREYYLLYTQYVILSLAIIIHFIGKLMNLNDLHKNYDISKEKHQEFTKIFLKLSSFYSFFLKIILPLLMVLFSCIKIVRHFL